MNAPFNNAALERMEHDWINANKRKYCPDHTSKVHSTARDALPVEYLRKLVRDNCDLTGKKNREERALHVSALRYLPQAIMKLWENIPMPWETVREATVAFHTTGALTIITETPKVLSSVFKAQWGAMWTRMRKEKSIRVHFLRAQVTPVFDDEEPPVDYGDVVLDLPEQDSVPFDLDETENEKAMELLLATTNLSGNEGVIIPIQTQLTFFRQCRILAGEVEDSNYFYLFDTDTFLTGKALGVAIPGAPRFQPLYHDAHDEEEWTEFNDLNKAVIRQPLRTEHQLAFPHLYNSRPRNVSISSYHFPLMMYLRCVDPELDAFSYDPCVCPVPYSKTIHDCDRDGGFHEINNMPLDFMPFFSNLPLCTTSTAPAVELFWTNLTSRREFPLCRTEIQLVNSWSKERSLDSLPAKVRISYQKILKQHTHNSMVKRKKDFGICEKQDNPHQVSLRSSKQSLGDFLLESRNFISSRVDWLEAGLQLCRQAHNMLTLLLQRRNMDFLHLDYNFHLKPVKALTTRQRKRSRLGPAFHLPREIMGLTKSMLDLHVKHRLGELDAFQLADALQYLFTHVGKLTGLYRYKYRIMRQIKWAKDIKHILYYRFNTGPVGKGPGMGFWVPVWQMWLSFFRGIVPVVQRYISNMLSREFEGRNVKGNAKKVTKQRSEANYDRELRQTITQEVADMIPPGMREKKIKLVLQHFSEAWRRRKSNQPWRVLGLSPNIEALILRFVKRKEEWWAMSAQQNRMRVISGQAVDKASVRKNHGRLVRLQLKTEQERQKDWISNGPYLSTNDFTGIYTLMAKWLASQKFQPIPFPPVNYKHDMKILRLALDKLKENHGAPGSRTTSTAKTEQLKIEEAFNNPQSTINGIKKRLMQMRSFKDMTIEYVDFFTHMLPVYDIEPDEKIMDAYLTQYLFYESSRRGLFPSWIKPSDDLPNPARLYNWCQSINNVPGVWETSRGESTIYVETKIEHLSDKVEHTLLNQMLRLVMDTHLADYMTARNNASLTYKDMNHTQNYGIIRGLQFAPFLIQFWGLAIDLTILGLARAAELCDGRDSPSHAMNSRTASDFQAHHIKMYMRYLDKVHILYRFSQRHASDLIAKFRPKLSGTSDLGREINSYKIHQHWPKDMRMRLLSHDVCLGRSTFDFVKKRIPVSLASITLENTYISVYSRDNPQLQFSMNGFEVCIRPRARMLDPAIVPEDQNIWSLIDHISKAATAFAYLRVAEEEVKQLEIRLRLVLLNSGQTPFKKLVEKWNTQLAAFVAYYREAIYGTPSVLPVLLKGETRIQNRIKVQLNSKMAKRFPPVVFYAPTDLWGLGMLSVGHSLIPQTDLRYGKQSLSDTTHFLSGLSHDVGVEIPNVLRYITPWQEEMNESARVWREYRLKSEDATRNNRRIVLEDINEMRGLGVPRIATAFQADKQTLLYDVGWRVRQEFKVHNVQRPQPFWYMNVRHDGKLFNFDKYKADVVQTFGGIESILSHSIFGATGYEAWEGLDWNRISKFEENMKGKKISHAQRGGLSKIPNQRFALWWSPTLNRSSVYMGFLTQIDLTGIMMHAKLPLVKASLVQIFQNHLWQKIHEGIVVDICKVLETRLSKLGIQSLQKCHTAPRKSFRMSSGSADITMLATGRWSLSRPSLLSESGDKFSFTSAKNYWIDVQIRWGDYDSHDAEKYARSKFLSYTTNRGEQMYPCPTGVMVVFDLAYNVHSAYGYWIPGLKSFLEDALQKIQLYNTELYRLRSNLNAKLQLAPREKSEPPLSVQNCDDLFSGKAAWIVDGSCAHLAIPQRTFEGNLTTKAINGAVLVINPKSGQLFLLVVHADTWKGQRRLSNLAKLKVAESVAALVRSLPKDEYPKSIISMQRHSLEVLNGTLSGLTNTVIKGSNLLVPFRALLKVPKIHEIVSTAAKSQSHIIGLYDDWLDTISPLTAFFRLLILLRALNVNESRCRTILRSVARSNPSSHHMWPKLEAGEWLHVETSLKDLIVADYCKRNAVDVSRITPTEIRDILLGQEIASLSVQQARSELIDRAKQTIQTDAIRKSGKIKESRKGNTKSFVPRSHHSKTEWRQRALATRARPEVSEVDTLSPKHVQSHESVILPSNILYMVSRCSDVYNKVVVLLYGRKLEAQCQVICAVFPAQIGTHENVTFSYRQSEHPLFNSLTLIGVLTTCFELEYKPTNSDLIMMTNVAKDNYSDAHDLFYITVFLNGGKATLATYRTSSSGNEVLKNLSGNPNEDSSTTELLENAFAQCEIQLGQESSGFYLVPEDGIWNYSFLGVSPPQYPSTLIVDAPHDYHNPYHRKEHFIRSNVETTTYSSPVQEVDSHFIADLGDDMAW